MLIPVFVILFYLPYQWSYMAAALVFILSAATDWFDGYLARKLNQSTAFGAFLDPVADKIMVAAAWWSSSNTTTPSGSPYRP